MYRIAVLFLTLFLTINETVAQTDFTWSEDIACIIYSHCTTCHNSNGVAPFALESYDDVVTFKDNILLQVTNRSMPPWPAQSPFGLQGDNSLSDEEINAISEWVINETPMGDIANEPTVPVFDTDIVIQDPDLIIEIPEFTVPNLSDNDLYKCFVFPMNFGEDIYVTGIEVVPGNKRAVHHVLLYEDDSNIPISLDNADPEIGYQCFGGIGSNNATLVGGWAPGGDPQFMPEGMGIRISANTNLVAQVHYPSYAVGEVDQTDIRIKYTTANQRNLSVSPVLNHFTSMIDGPLIIQPNDVRTFNQVWTVPTKMTITGVAPHAHLICTSMKSWAETPSGEIIDLVDIPNWDFDWQKFYGYNRPVVLEQGTRIFGRATYDNTVNNHHNPNFPPQLITLGEDTDEEMMVFFYTMTFYQPGDENLVFAEHNHAGHVEDCGFALTDVDEQLISSKIHLHPNPVSKTLYIDSELSVTNIIVFNLLGHKVIDVSGGEITAVDTSELAPGTYSIQIRSEGLITSQLFVVER